MSRRYKIRDQQEIYFVTFTVIQWIDVFVRNEYRVVFVDRPEVWLYSSAGDYILGQKGMIDLKWIA